MLIAGVDDAGRGCVIGPLVIAGVLMREENLPKLKELGVKDSKLLSPNKRELLAIEIRKLAKNYAIEKLHPNEIDQAVLSSRKLHKLNRLEADTMAKVIEKLQPDIVYVDASDVLEKRFKAHIADNLSHEVKIISEHKADRTYPIVSAASIIAKTERDKEIRILTKTHGNFGSGYPSDPCTMKFLEQCITTFGNYPDFVRKSWKPAKVTRSKKDSCQTKLI